MSTTPLFPEGPINQPEQNLIGLSYSKVLPGRTVPRTVNNLPTFNRKTVPDALQLTPEYRKQAAKRKKLTTIFLIISTIVLSLLFAGVSLIGGGVTFFLALIPLTGIVLATFWIGKWDPEPLWLRTLAFLWGAIGSVALTFALGGLFVLLPGMGSFEAGVVIQAPVVEEFCKGLFVLVLALFVRKYFTGPIDGVVYMILAAAGFAFTENILYFIQSQVEGGIGALTVTFFLRAIMSPFAHPLFSLPMGILLGYAVARNMSKLKTILLFIPGYIAGMILHAMWNGSSLFITDPLLWLGYYFILQIPIFVGAVLIVQALRKEEANRTYRALTGYGWDKHFTKEEVEALGTWEGRRYAKKWAKTKNQNIRDLVHSLNRDVVALTHIKPFADAGDEQKKLQEQLLLEKIRQDKQELLTA